MAKFKIHPAGISTITQQTLQLFEEAESLPPKKLSAAVVAELIKGGKQYKQLDLLLDGPFRPNPVEEPAVGMMIFAHPDDPKDPSRMIALYYDYKGMNTDGTAIISPRKWLIGPRAMAVIPYQWTCCGGWSAIFATSDATYEPTMDSTKATATIQDPRTIQDHHEQFFNRKDGGEISHDCSGIIRHAALHLLEALGQNPKGHNCSDHAHIHTGHALKAT